MTGIEDWRGRVGSEWAARADAMEGLLGPLGQAGLDALGDVEGARVLDLGCGAGDTAWALARRGADVTGIDVSEDLLALARASDPDGVIDWRLEDAAQAQFETRFDALYSRCGAMFFDAPEAAFAHLRGQMVPGGRLAIAVWRGAAENGWARLPLEAARPVMGAEATTLPPAGGAGPFGWAEPDGALAMLNAAGWRDVSVEPVDTGSVIGTGDDPGPVARAVAFTLRIGVLASRLRGAEPEVRDAVRAHLVDAFAPHVRDGQVRLPAAGWVFKATA